MLTTLLLTLALPLAACASTGDYQAPAAVEPVLVAPRAAGGAVQQPIAQVDTFQVIPAPPMVPMTPAPIVRTPSPGDTVWQPLSQGGTLQPYTPYRPIHLN